MAQLKIEKNGIFAVLVVFLLSLGFWHFPAKDTLPDFNAAMAIQRLPAMSSMQPLHLQAAAAIEGIYASLLGQDAFSPQAIASFLLIFPSILLALTALCLYLALRQLDFRRSIAAFGSLLFSLSLSSMQFLPGVYTSQSLAAFFLSLFMLFFNSYYMKQKLVMLLPALLFAALAGYINPAFGAAGILLVLSFAYASRQKGGKNLAKFGAIAVVFIAAAFLSPETQPLSFSVKGMQSLFSLAPFLLAAASCSVALFFYRAAQVQHLLLFLFGILVSALSPLAGAMLLIVPAAEGISQAASEKLSSKQAKLACALLLAFFAIYGMAVTVSGELKATVVALLLSFLSPLLVHFYGYKNSSAFAAWGLGLLVLSASLALFYQLPPQKEFYPAYSDRDISNALSQLTGKGVPKVALIGHQDAARFYLPSSDLESQQRLSEYMGGGKNVPDSGSYLVLSLSYFDGQTAVPEGGFETYFFYANFTSSGRNFAQFVSASSGAMLVRELDTKGDFALRDGQLIDPSGRVYANVPLSRMLPLRQGAPFFSPQNRLVVIDEGEPVPYFIKIYSGSADELAKVSESGKVSVFRVK